MTLQITRRQFIGTSAAASLAPLTLHAQSTPQESVLVNVFLRGGADALSLLAPSDSAQLRASRPADLRLDNGIRTDISTRFDWRLSPLAEPLLPLMQSNQLAWVWGVGQSLGTRSHFQAQLILDQGSNRPQNGAKGWLSKLRSGLPETPTTPGRRSYVFFVGELQTGFPRLRDTVSVHGGGQLPQSWYGDADVLVLGDEGDNLIANESEFFLSYANARKTGSVFANSIDNLFKVTSLGKIDADPRYPQGDFGEQLKRIATYVKSGLGLRLASADFSGWDTHEYQTATTHQLIPQLAKGLSAFWEDLGIYRRHVTVVVHSEFGRRIPSNANAGTDHGRGGIAMVLADQVESRKLHGESTSAADALDLPGDIPVRIDFRQLLSTCAGRQFPSANLADVFADYPQQAPLGIFRT